MDEIKYAKNGIRLNSDLLEMGVEEYPHASGKTEAEKPEEVPAVPVETPKASKKRGRPKS